MGRAVSKYEAQSDEGLMELVVQRDERAFAALYDRYSRRLLHYFATMLRRDEEKAQDMLQDLFMKLADKPELYQSGRNFKTWIFSIANNMCKNEYRGREVRGRVHEELKHSLARQTKAPEGNGLDRETFGKELAKALDELEDIRRETFLLRYHEEMSIQEISELQQCSEGTVKSRLFYTLRDLNRRLKAFQHLCFIALMRLLDML